MLENVRLLGSGTILKCRINAEYWRKKREADNLSLAFITPSSCCDISLLALPPKFSLTAQIAT